MMRTRSPITISNEMARPAPLVQTKRSPEAKNFLLQFRMSYLVPFDKPVLRMPTVPFESLRANGFDDKVMANRMGKAVLPFVLSLSKHE